MMIMMDDQVFQEKLTELVNSIDRLPDGEQSKIRNLADETKVRHARMKGIIGELNDSLDHLRLSVKYLVFDLEATRRENRYLRQMLEDLQNRKDD